MYSLALCGIFVCFGIVGNSLVIFITRWSIGRTHGTRILLLHMSYGNKLYLVSRFFSLLVPMAYPLCYPASNTCKAVNLVMNTSQNVSGWCLVALSWYRCMKLRRLCWSSMILSKLESSSKVHFLLVMHWIAWALLYIPFLMLIPPSLNVNLTDDCRCSLPDIVASSSGFVSSYGILYLMALQYISATLMSIFNGRIILFLLQHRLRAISDKQGNNRGRLEKELNASMVLIALVSLYDTCIILQAVLTYNLRSKSATLVRNALSDTYATIIPFIIMLGHRASRLWLISCWKNHCRGISQRTRVHVLSLA